MKHTVIYDPTSKTCLRYLKNGREAGFMDNCGYYRFTVKGRKYLCHRVVYHLLTGFDLTSPMVIDHIDRNRSNNLIENLREVTKAENNNNRAIPAPSYCKQTGKWKAIASGGKWLGRHATQTQAQEVIVEYERAKTA